jgi:hypothetical protein
MDRCGFFYNRLADDYVCACLEERINTRLHPHLGGYCSSQLGGCSLGCLGNRCCGLGFKATASMTTASGIAAPSPCVAVITSTRGEFKKLRLLRMMTTSCEEHIPSTKVASFNFDSTATYACGGSVGSCSSAERSSPPA